MIDSGIRIEFLDPELWTHLGEILRPFSIPEKVLHVLNKEGGGYRAVDSNHQFFQLSHYLAAGKVDTEKIFQNFYDIMEIRIYTLEGLKTCHRRIQQTDIYSRDIDEAISEIYREFERTEGITIIRRRERGDLWYLDRIKRLFDIGERDGIFLLWITKDNKLYFNCIFEAKRGKLVGISTSDRYGSEKDYGKVCRLIEKEFGVTPYTACMELSAYCELI